MDRETLQRCRRHGEGFIALGRQHVAEQRRTVGDLNRAGLDASTARALLAAYQEMLEMHEAICARITEQLADLAVAAGRIGRDGAPIDTYAPIEFGRSAFLLRAGMHAKDEDQQPPTLH
jgi:hypothetical protein